MIVTEYLGDLCQLDGSCAHLSAWQRIPAIRLCRLCTARLVGPSGPLYKGCATVADNSSEHLTCHLRSWILWQVLLLHSYLNISAAKGITQAFHEILWEASLFLHTSQPIPKSTGRQRHCGGKRHTSQGELEPVERREQKSNKWQPATLRVDSSSFTLRMILSR